MNNNQFFAEITQSSLSEWTGQCWKWDVAPKYGSLVMTQNNNAKLYGIVYSITTGSSHPVRTPTAYQKTEEELLRDQPQIFSFLQTTFKCIIVGYQENKKIFYHLPSQPAKIHGFIAQATEADYEDFFANNQFLHLLFNASSQINNIDELLLATLKMLHEQKGLNKTSLTDFIETFSMLCKNDYQRLKIFLHRINHVCSDYNELSL